MKKPPPSDHGPFERADITSNPYWDWSLNQIGGVYGAMEEVFTFMESFKAFPPRPFPPSFVPSTLMEQTLEGIREERRREQEKK